MKAPQRPVLASGTVHFAGEGVAVVVARSAAEARDAGDLVEVDYDPLEPVLDMEAALAEGATLVHPDLGTNENATWVFDSGAAGTGGQRRRTPSPPPRPTPTRSWSSAGSASSG